MIGILTYHVLSCFVEAIVDWVENREYAFLHYERWLPALRLDYAWLRDFAHAGLNAERLVKYPQSEGKEHIANGAASDKSRLFRFAGHQTSLDKRQFLNYTLENLMFC